MQRTCIVRYVLWPGVCPSVIHTLVCIVETTKRFKLVFGTGTAVPSVYPKTVLSRNSRIGNTFLGKLLQNSELPIFGAPYATLRLLVRCVL